MITNGKGWIFEAEVVIPNHNKCVVNILKSTFEAPRPYTIHLAVAPTKMNDRYEWFIEKATEIGVDKSHQLFVKIVNEKSSKQNGLKNLTICDETIASLLFTNLGSCHSFF